MLRGFFGTAYIAALKPFRHLIIYPLMMRQLERAWQEALAGDGARDTGAIADGDATGRSESRS